MCAINLWAVNAAAFTPDFHRFTAERIGLPPQPQRMRIVSDQVRTSAAVFSLSENMCDCSSFIGLRDERPSKDEPAGATWLAWLLDLPDHVPHLSRLAVLRAWSPEEGDVVPEQEHGIRSGQLTEDVLRGIDHDSLLTIDYPRMI